MGLLGDLVSSAVSGVSKVVSSAANGVAGVVNEACLRIGLPPAIANIVSMAFDPLHAGENFGKLIDDTCSALGVPDDVRKALKKVCEKAQSIAQTAVTQGVGGVIREVGAELGLPPALCATIALAADAATGNGAAVTQSAIALAEQAAAAMGLPKGITDFAALGASIAAGNPDAIRAQIADVAVTIADGLDMPQEWKDMVHVGAALTTGDTESATAAGLQLGAHIGERLGLPPEASSVLAAGVALYQGDTEGLKAAGRTLGNDVIDRLPPEVRGPLRRSLESIVSDPQGAIETVKNLPVVAQAVFERVANAATIDPERLASSVKVIYEEAKANLSEAERSALEIAEHIATANRDGLKSTLENYADRGIQSLPLPAQEILRAVGDLVSGETSWAEALEAAKDHAKRKLAEEIYVPMRM